MSDEIERKGTANFNFTSSASIPSTNQQFTTTLNLGGYLYPSSDYTYINDANGAYYYQSHPSLPQFNSFLQQPPILHESFMNPYNSEQTPDNQYSQPFMMGHQVNTLINQGSALGAQDVTSPFCNEQSINPQPQEFFSSTLNSGNLGTQPPTSFFNVNPNMTGSPNNFAPTESLINQMPQIQRITRINGNDFNTTLKPIPLQGNWTFAPNQLNSGRNVVYRVTPSKVEAQQNYLLRIEQVTLINAIPIDSNCFASERLSSSQTSTNIHHQYSADSHGLTVVSQVGDNKPQVIKLDTESIKQMLNNNSSFYIQQFLNGPTGKVTETTCVMQTDGSHRNKTEEIGNNCTKSGEEISILEPRELHEEASQEDFQQRTSRDYLEFDGKGNFKLNESYFIEKRDDIEPDPWRYDEDNNPISER